MKLEKQDREAYRLDGVMVLSTTDLRFVATALRHQLEREKRLLTFLMNSLELTDKPRREQRRLEEQRKTVDQYEQLLRRVVGQL